MAMDEEASIGCGDTRAFCPTEPYNFSSGDPLDAITCDRCAIVNMENWDQRIWLGGEVRWTPFARAEEDEMQLEGSMTAPTELDSVTKCMGQLFGFHKR